MVGNGATLLRDPAWGPLLKYMWREGLVQGDPKGLEPFHRLSAAEDVQAGVIAPMYNHPSGPWTWLAFAGRGGGRAAEKEAAAQAEAEANKAPQEAYDWKKDLQADASAAVKKEEAGADHAAVKEEPEQQSVKVEAAPPKRKKPKFL